MIFNENTGKWEANQVEINQAKALIREAKAFKRREKRRIKENQTKLEQLIAQELYGLPGGDIWRE